MARQIQNYIRPPRFTRPSVTLLIMALTVICWIFLSGRLGIAVIALLGGIVMFATRSIRWKDVEERIPWGIILLYGGA